MKLETIAIILLAMVGIALLLALPTLWLWNWLMPVIFKLPTITFSQALGLNILSGIWFRTSVRSQD